MNAFKLRSISVVSHLAIQSHAAMNFTTLVSILLVTFFSQEALCAPKDCARLKEDTLNLWLTVKDACDDGIKDCCQITKGASVLDGNRESGVFEIELSVCLTREQPFLSDSKSITVIQALCDLKTDNGGWLVILRRKADVSPLVNFNRSWVEYENGFGDLNTEFWYGLKNIHCLTQRDDVELMIELKLNDGTGITWTYQTFRVDGPKTNYVLHIGGAERIEGTGSDRMAYHNGQQFTTIDRDNDQNSGNCATANGGGGWWYNNCYQSVLTRPHTGTHKIYWHGSPYFPHVEMKIRPKTCLGP